MTDEATARPGEFVQSLERGLAVIRAFDAEHPQLTLSEVARHTGLTRAAADASCSPSSNSATYAPTGGCSRCVRASSTSATPTCPA